eukprot:133817_1
MHHLIQYILHPWNLMDQEDLSHNNRPTKPNNTNIQNMAGSTHGKLSQYHQYRGFIPTSSLYALSLWCGRQHNRVHFVLNEDDMCPDGSVCCCSCANCDETVSIDVE